MLFLKPGPIPSPLIHGGQQQQDRRSGSEDAAGAAALAAALAEAQEELAGDECARQRTLLETAFADIQSALPDARWLGRGSPQLSNTLSLAHPGLKSDPLVMRLDMAGIAVSRGSACMAARKEPSHVIRALKLKRMWRARSFASPSATSPAPRTANALPKPILRLRKILGR